MNFPAKVFLIVAVAAPLLTAKTFYEERDTAPVTTGSVANLKADNVQGAPVAPDGPDGPTKLSSSSVFTPPQEADLPENPFGELVREGRDIFVNTQKNAPDFVGNGLNCSNCHLDQGRKAGSAPLWGGLMACTLLIEKRTTRSILLQSACRAVSSSV